MKIQNGTSYSKQLEDIYNLISELTKPVKEQSIYHYTTIDALFSGIISKKLDSQWSVCLWATSGLYMNDVSELKTGFEFVKKIFREYFFSIEDEKTISDLTDLISDYYLLSFSLRRDFLPMWRMYANNATGVSLCFDVGLIEKYIKQELIKCVYLTDGILERIQSCLAGFKPVKTSSDKLNITIFVILLAILKSDYKNEFVDGFVKYVKFVSALKNSAYSDEDEIRLITVSTNKDVKFRLKENKIIPYIEHLLPKEALTEIIVGPNNDMSRTVFSLRAYLNNIGFEHVKITASEIPYRD